MTTVHFCYRVTADRLERIEEDGLPPSIRPSQPPPGLVILHAQMPGSEVIDVEKQREEMAQAMAAAAQTGQRWIIVTIEDVDLAAPRYHEIQEKAEAELRKDPDMYARYLAGGGFQPGRSLKQWREYFGGDQGEWPEPTSSLKVPVSLEAWVGQDPDRTILAITLRTYWNVFDA